MKYNRSHKPVWIDKADGMRFLNSLTINWVVDNWECKYLDIRFDARTGLMLLLAGNTDKPFYLVPLD